MVMTLYGKEVNVCEDLVKALESNGDLKVNKDVIDIYLKMDGVDGTKLNEKDLSKTVNESLEREIKMQEVYKDTELIAALAMHGVRKMRGTKNYQ